MANSKSYSDVLKGSINTRCKPVIMEIFESQKHSEWAQFRNIAIEILNHAQKYYHWNWTKKPIFNQVYLKGPNVF